MARQPSRQWLGRLLEGHEPDAPELKTLVEQCEEDQWLEYKSGQELKDGRKAARTLRQYVAGFANADGGVLLIGYDAGDDGNSLRSPRAPSFDGAVAPGKDTLLEWAAQCVRSLPIAPPRWFVPSVDGVHVLAVACGRSRTLVPCVEDGETIYYYRIGDQTLPMPQSLVYDLLVGRRSETELAVEMVPVPDEASWKELPRTSVDDGSRGDWPRARWLRVGLKITNMGLAFADDVRAGLVSWTFADDGVVPPSPSILRAVDIASPPPYHMAAVAVPPVDWALHNTRSGRLQLPGQPFGTRIDLGPFELSYLEKFRDWRVPVFTNYHTRHMQPPSDPDAEAAFAGRVRMRAALYVVAKGGEPWWHQVTFDYGEHVATLSGSALLQHLRVEPVFEGRPRVGLEFKRLGA